MAESFPGGYGPAARSGTPPRSGAAPIRLLRVCLGERVLGGVEVSELSTLADVRAAIAEDEIHGLPDRYLFLFGGAPVSRRQEPRRRAVECFPLVTVMQEGAHVPAVGAASALAPATSAAAAPAVLQAATLPGAEAVMGPTALPNASLDELGLEDPHGHSVAPLEYEPRLTLELQITDGPLEGTSITVGDDGARVGRHTSNDLVIPEPGISRYHCEICRVGSGFCVRDLGSTTGTYFYLRPHARMPMFPGLMVKLGETEFQVLSQEPGGGDGVAASAAELCACFYEGPLSGHKCRMPAGGITIGRRHNNSLVLVHDTTVSAHHAQIVGGEDGCFFLCDLGSCNGTCVRLSPEQTESDWHPIMDGDVLGAGCTKVRCRLHDLAGLA